MGHGIFKNSALGNAGICTGGGLGSLSSGADTVTTWGKIGDDETSAYVGGGYTYDKMQPCNSDPIIRAVQAKIGAGIDGKWGPESQRKLTASGQSFQALAPGCTPPVPSYSSGGGYILPTPQPTQPAVVAPPEAQAGMLTGITGALTQKFAGLPVGVWGLGIFVLTAGAVAVAREKGWV